MRLLFTLSIGANAESEAPMETCWDESLSVRGWNLFGGMGEWIASGFFGFAQNDSAWFLGMGKESRLDSRTKCNKF